MVKKFIYADSRKINSVFAAVISVAYKNSRISARMPCTKTAETSGRNPPRPSLPSQTLRPRCGNSSAGEPPESKACSIRVRTRRLHQLAPFFDLAAVIGSELFRSAPDRIRARRSKPFFDIEPPQDFHRFLLQP